MGIAHCELIGFVAAIGMASPGAAQAVAQVATGPVPKVVQIATGPRLEYVEQGDRAGIAVILLHGYTDSWRSYERVLPFLPKHFHVFAVSQRGHGNSDRPLDGYRAQDFARDVAGFLDAVHVKSAVVVGHSMGARNAMRFAIDYPQRTRALVLVGAFMPGPPNAAVQEFWDTSVSRLTDPIDPAFARAFQQDTLAQRVPPEFFDTVVAESLKVPARVWKAALSGLMSGDFAADLPKITAPVLLIHSRDDDYVLKDFFVQPILEFQSCCGQLSGRRAFHHRALMGSVNAAEIWGFQDADGAIDEMGILGYVAQIRDTSCFFSASINSGSNEINCRAG